MGTIIHTHTVFHFTDEPGPECTLTLVVGQFPPFSASPPLNIMKSGCRCMIMLSGGAAEGVSKKASEKKTPRVLSNYEG